MASADWDWDVPDADEPELAGAAAGVVDAVEPFAVLGVVDEPPGVVGVVAAPGLVPPVVEGVGASAGAAEVGVRTAACCCIEPLRRISAEDAPTRIGIFPAGATHASLAASQYASDSGESWMVTFLITTADG